VAFLVGGHWPGALTWPMLFFLQASVHGVEWIIYAVITRKELAGMIQAPRILIPYL
jgi:hypothetical protein